MPKTQRTKQSSKTDVKGTRSAAKVRARVTRMRGKKGTVAATKSTTSTPGAKVQRDNEPKMAAKGRVPAGRAKGAAKPKGATTAARATKGAAKLKRTTKQKRTATLTAATKKRPTAAAKPKASLQSARSKAAKTARPAKATAKLAKAKMSMATKTKNGQAKPARRDAVGRLNPQYARDLRAISRESRDTEGDDRAFFKTSRSGDDLAEELGEEAVATMTTGEDQSERMDTEVDEERGGPFVKTRSRDEFARGTDRSNPRGSTREPFPRT